MGTRQDAKALVDKIQAKIDRYETQRDTGLKSAAKQYSDACASARREQLETEKKVKERLDPVIADLKKRLKDAKRELTPPQMRPDRKFGLRSFEA